MKRLLFIAFAAVCLAACSGKNDFVEHSFSSAAVQYAAMAESLPATNCWPHSVKNDELQTVGINWWTVGFFPGSLWYLYEYTGEERFRDYATRWTESLEENQFDTSNHDIGFEMFCSYGNALRLTGNKAYEQVLINSAKSLCTRFNSTVGCIQSWNARVGRNGKDYWAYPVIIDNMMNLELLFEAAKMSGEKVFYDVAVSHANTTMKNHIRPDYSTYHVVDYEPTTGEVAHRRTMQGFADNSTWARGQAWGIYGFTMCYRYTRDAKYLQTACRLADFVLDNPRLPKDGIPVWDYNVGEEGFTPVMSYTPEQIALRPRDASAAAVMASAMLELSGYCDKAQGKKYFDGAERMLRSLASDEYLAAKGTNHNFILKHSTGNMPVGNEVDVPLNYADYYFLEALLRYDKLVSR